MQPIITEQTGCFLFKNAFDDAAAQPVAKTMRKKGESVSFDPNPLNGVVDVYLEAIEQAYSRRRPALVLTKDRSLLNAAITA